jgi:ABC-2 type transport system permease protein
MDIGKLWKERAHFFWGEVLPYFRYVASSGLAAFLIILFIVSTHYYANLLEQLPENFPVNWIALICLLPVLTLSPIRTFFKPADIIFLLPAEHRMKPYIQNTMIFSLVVQSVFTTVIWFVIWPMYRVSMGANGDIFFVLLFVLLVMKWTNLYGHWQEEQFQERNHRTLYTLLLRWVLTAVLLYLLFTFTLMKVVFITALVLLTYIISLRLPSKFMIHWDHLIKIEQQQRAKYYVFLSWFVDVPELHSRVSARRIISKISNMLAFTQQNTFRYLYLKTFIRSEIFGIILRLTFVGATIIFFLPQGVLKIGFFLFFIYLIGVQLSALEQHHRYTFWIHVYPLAKEERINSVLHVIIRIHMVIVLLLFLVVFFTMTIKLNAIYLFIGTIMLFTMYHYRLRKNLGRRGMDG